MICAAFLGENSTIFSASEAFSPWHAAASGRPLNADIRELRVTATYACSRPRTLTFDPCGNFASSLAPASCSEPAEMHPSAAAPFLLIL